MKFRRNINSVGGGGGPLLTVLDKSWKQYPLSSVDDRFM